MFNLIKFIQNFFLTDNRIDDINYKISQILIRNSTLTREDSLKLRDLFYKKGDYELAYTMDNYKCYPQTSRSANNSYKKYIG